MLTPSVAVANPVRREVPPPLIHSDSRSFPIRVSTPDILVNAEILRLVEDSWRGLERVLGPLEAPSGTRFVFYFLPVEGSGAWDGVVYPRSLVYGRNSVEFRVFIADDPKRYPRPVVRTAVLAYLQWVVWRERTDRLAGGEVPDPPFWLWEGVTEATMHRRHRDWQQVVWRLSQRDRLPALIEVQQWQEAGGDVVEASARRAVAYWLVRHVAQTPAEQQSIRLWLEGTAENSLRTYWPDRMETEIWWRQVAGLSERSEIPVAGWEETARALQAQRYFSFYDPESEKRLIYDVLDLPELGKPLKSVELVEWQERVINIQLASHWLWQPVVGNYLIAVAEWSAGRHARYAERRDEIIEKTREMERMRRGVGDLMDWLTVNYEIGDSPDGRGRYAEVVRELREERERLREEWQVRDP